MKQIIDEENLDSPKNSVEFLEYVKKHGKKVKQHKKRLHRVSKLLLIIGAASLGYFALRHFIHRQRMHGDKHHGNDYSGRDHRLGASAELESDNAYGQTFSFLSVSLWGLVVAKAKSGMDATK